MVIVQNATSSQTPSRNIETNKLKHYKTNAQDPYITAVFKADILPTTFVIGDGKTYEKESYDEKESYLNQPLRQNTNYTVFLRFLENEVTD
jgi:hypothetical protein